MKKGLILSAVLLLLAVSDVSAKNVAKNKDTGNGSINTASVKNTSTTKATTKQNAFVLNGVVVLQNTGLNSVKDNTKVLGPGPAINTGNTTANITIDNKVNKSTTVVTGCGCEGDNKAVNDLTGNGSINTATVENKNTTTAKTEQDAVLINVVVVAQNSGLNEVEGNTKVAGTGVDTGNTKSNITVDNKVNESTTVVTP